MKRYEDAKVLLELADETLEHINREYDVGLKSQQLPVKVPGRIKTLLDQLRAPLDFIAKEIAEVKCGHNGRSYYPAWCGTRVEFDRHMDQNLPGLARVDQGLYDQVEYLQSYNATGCQAIAKLNSLVNKNKHDQLSPQTRSEKRGLKIEFPGGASIQMGPGSSISGGGTISSGGGWFAPQGGSVGGESPAVFGKKIRQEVQVWVSFAFSDTGEEVLPLLQKARDEVDLILSKVKPLLWP